MVEQRGGALNRRITTRFRVEEEEDSRLKENGKGPNNTNGIRNDVGWKYVISIDGSIRKIQCKYCTNIFNGGIYRLKHHLDGTQKDVEPCKNVTDEVRK
ncbi:hypothetical protein Lal_00036648 [Lupinus albus]|nr:hypothetical protein Lal_00036648 [Lupinus albus]